MLVMPAVGSDSARSSSGEILLVQGELGVEGKVGFSPVVGLGVRRRERPTCRGLDDVKLVNEFKTKSKIPFENDICRQVHGSKGLGALLCHCGT